MATPKVPKEPKDEVDKEDAKQQMKAIEEKKAIGKENVARTDDGKDKMGKPAIESTGPEKASARSTKAEAESKAKKEAEIKTSRTGERTSATSIAIINKTRQVQVSPPRFPKILLREITNCQLSYLLVCRWRRDSTTNIL